MPDNDLGVDTAVLIKIERYGFVSLALYRVFNVFKNFCKFLLPFLSTLLSFKILKALINLTDCRRICLLALLVVCITVTLTIVTQRTLCDFLYVVSYKVSNLRIRVSCLPSAVIAASASGALQRGSCRHSIRRPVCS